MTKLLAALLPIVIAMLSNRGAQGGPAAGQARVGPSAGGGGLGGLLEQLQRAGFGGEADSWVGSGANSPLPPDAMCKVFGRESLQEISRRTGSRSFCRRWSIT